MLAETIVHVRLSYTKETNLWEIRMPLQFQYWAFRKINGYWGLGLIIPASQPKNALCV